MENIPASVTRLAAAGLAILVLSMAGIVLLAFSQEVLRTEVRELRQDVLERAGSGASPAAADIAALREALSEMSRKLDALAGKPAETARSVDRLSVEVKNLANRVEAMAAARAKPAAGGGKSSPRPRGAAGPADAPPPPYYPPYPVYPPY